MATFNGRWSLTRSGHYERVEWVYILSTLLGSFILTWTIHEVYCHLKMMNFSVDVLVYRPSAFPEKKKKRKGSFPQGVGVTSTPVLPYSYMYSNATGWQVHMSLACPRGRRMLAQWDCIMGGATLRISLRSEVGGGGGNLTRQSPLGQPILNLSVFDFSPSFFH